MERLKIAITGASGFIGSNLVRHFDDKHEVYALARQTDNWRLGTNFNILKFDVRKSYVVQDVIKRLKPDVLIHCATYGAYHFETEPKKIIETNILGSLNLINASIDVPMIINVGSSSEYGIRTTPMREDDTTAPVNDYAISKVLQTNLFRSARNSITLRIFSAYGYYEEIHRLIPYLVYSSIKNQKATLSKKSNVRDFVFIEDVVDAFSLTIQRYSTIKEGSVFNVGSGHQRTIEDVANEIGVYVEWDLSVRPEEPTRMWKADISKIKEELS